VRHLRDLGLPNISEENITQLSVGGQKMTWVNFHPRPTKCPKEVCQQKSTRVTFWSRKLSLSVGRSMERRRRRRRPRRWWRMRPRRACGAQRQVEVSAAPATPPSHVVIVLEAVMVLVSAAEAAVVLAVVARRRA
jgi:hypothetical protein